MIAPVLTPHPAKYSDRLLPIFEVLLENCPRVFDPFAGVGKLRKINHTGTIFLNELEPEWAIQGPSDTIADSLHLPYADEVFDAICTSCVYGNRMSDNFEAHDHSIRHTYRHYLGRPLSKHNAGRLQWGGAYRSFHLTAWEEVRRVLRIRGIFILNISDHIRMGKVMPVTEWHKQAITGLGFSLLDSLKVRTPRQKNGENYSARVDYESVLVFRKEDK